MKGGDGRRKLDLAENTAVASLGCHYVELKVSDAPKTGASCWKMMTAKYYNVRRTVRLYLTV